VASKSYWAGTVRDVRGASREDSLSLAEVAPRRGPPSIKTRCTICVAVPSACDVTGPAKVGR